MLRIPTGTESWRRITCALPSPLPAVLPPETEHSTSVRSLSDLPYRKLWLPAFYSHAASQEGPQDFQHWSVVWGRGDEAARELEGNDDRYADHEKKPMGVRGGRRLNKPLR